MSWLNAVVTFEGKLRPSFPFVDRANPARVSLGASETCALTQAIYQGEQEMGKRDELIEQYADDLRNKCGMEPDMDLLTKVTLGCGPAIYNADASTVAATQESELETVKTNFLMKKLGLSDGPELMDAINSVMDTYGRSERNKYRAVVYYMLTKQFGKESVYG